MVVACLRFRLGREGSTFPLVDKDEFWFASNPEGLLVVPCSMTFHVPGRNEHVEGLTENSGVPLS